MEIQHDSYAIEESSVVAAASNQQNFGPEVVSKQPLSIPKK
jgi:hypothetical protein